MSKLLATIRILSPLFCARMFGEYRHTIGGPDQPYVAVYEWRGQVWWIPTGSVQ